MTIDYIELEEQINTVTKKRIQLIIKMSSLFCSVLRNNMTSKSVNLNDSNLDKLVNNLKINNENKFSITENEINDLYYALIIMLINSREMILSVDYSPNRIIRNAFELIKFNDNIEFAFPFKSSIRKGFDKGNIYRNFIQTDGFSSLDEVYEVDDISDEDLFLLKHKLIEIIKKEDEYRFYENINRFKNIVFNLEFILDKYFDIKLNAEIKAKILEKMNGNYSLIHMKNVDSYILVENKNIRDVFIKTVPNNVKHIIGSNDMNIEALKESIEFDFKVELEFIKVLEISEEDLFELEADLIELLNSLDI